MNKVKCSDLVDKIEKRCKLELTEEQKVKMGACLQDFHWLPNEHNHIRVYKLYQEMKLATEAELAMMVAKSNTIISSKDKELADEYKLRIALLRTFADKLEDIVDQYTNTFISIMKSYDTDDGIIFKYYYFDGMSSKQIAQKTGLSLTKLYNMKYKFDKAISETEKILV